MAILQTVPWGYSEYAIKIQEAVRKALDVNNSADYNIGPYKRGIIPVKSVTSNETVLAACMWATLEQADEDGNSVERLAVIACIRAASGVDFIEIHAANAFLSGKVSSGTTKDEAKARFSALIEADLTALKINNKRNKLASILNKYDSVGSAELKTNNSFLTNLQAQKKFDDPTQAFINYVEFDMGLESCYSVLREDMAKFLKDSALANGAIEEAFEFIDKYAFLSPILLEGERGGGKTENSRLFAAANPDCEYIEYGCHEGVESADLLGTYRPYFNPQSGKQEFVWTDGPVTRALRLASRGQKVILVLDEILRVPPKQLSALLTPLSESSTGKLRISTDRVMGLDESGVGYLEQIELDARNICLIGTTNVGANYYVENMDKALLSRFMVKYIKYDETTVGATLKKICAARGIATEIGNKLLAFYKSMKAAQASNLIQELPNIRDFARALTISNGDLAVLTDCLNDHKGQWVAKDHFGIPIEAQCNYIEKAIDTCFYPS